MGSVNETRSAEQVDIRLRVNGVAHELTVEPRQSLADVLRGRLGLTGTKVVCERGACGACTVWLDGARVTACVVLAVMADDRAVTTIEGLVGSDGTLHPMQAAFVAHDAAQCGFCTPGQIMSAVALLRENPQPTAEEIITGMAGNLCRCGTYLGIRAAIAAVRDGEGRP